MIRFAIAAALVLSFAATAYSAEVAFEEDRSLPVVNLNVTIKAGAAHDPAGQSGLTNFVGEMLLRGTNRMNKEQIDLALDQMGAKLAVETRQEALIIRGSVLAAQLHPFLKIVTEILTQPSFPEAEIRKLRSEVVSAILEELAEDQTLAQRRFTRFLFRAHPYGNPILGTTRDVEKLTRAQIVQQYDRLVRDNLILVVGAGDASSSVIESWSKALGETRDKATARIKSRPVETVSAPENAPSRRLQIVDKPERTQTQIFAGQIGVRMTDSDFFPLYLGNYAFGGGSFSARLMVEIRVKRGWSYGANSFFRHGLKPRSWMLHLFPASKDAPPALDQVLKMVDELKSSGITPEEFDLAQRSLVSSAGFMYNTPAKRVENKLLERTLDLPDGFMKSYGPNLQKVKIEEANAAMASFLKPDRLAITVVGTASELKEGLAKAAGVPVEKVEVTPYTEE